MDTLWIIIIGIILLAVIVELYSFIKDKKNKSDAGYYEDRMRSSMKSQDGTKGKSAFYSDMMGKKAN